MKRRCRRLAAVPVAVVLALAAAQLARAEPAPFTAECPGGLDCRVAPAAYHQNSADPGDYGNYDLANRPEDGLSVKYVVIHDTEVAYDPTIALFQNPLAYVSAHYVLRSSDGQVTQMVPTKDVAWHAGNWWVNSHGIGLENEGFAQQGYDWYTNRLYLSIARLTRHLANKYGIPIDRDRILGHDEVPGPTSAFQAGMHWDPGPYFDWSHLFELMGAPITGAKGDKLGRIVTIKPTFATNTPPVSACEGGTIVPQQPRPANFVYLHSGPGEDTPLLSDRFLAGSAIEPGGVGSTCANDWGSKAVTGQTFAVAERSGDWTAIWYGAKKAWLHDPNGSATVAGSGTLVTPKAGRSTIPVYGRAYPESISTATLGYSIPAGQVYVADELVGADYYSASTFNAPETYHLFTGETRFYKISFNHRAAFLKASDVDVIP